MQHLADRTARTNLKVLQVLTGSNTTEHQQFGCVVSASTENNLTRGLDRLRLVLVGEGHTNCLLTLKQDLYSHKLKLL